MISVSYVVTLYNKEKFLPFIINGLALQAGPFEREFVFVNDGSTDNTLAILQKMTAQWQNTKILSQTNAGPAKATNVGVAAASGNFIKLLDGDDVLAPGATLSHLNALAKSNVDVSFASEIASYDFHTDSPQDVLCKLSNSNFPFEIESMPLYESIQRSTTTPSGVMIRQSLINGSSICDPDIFIQDYSMELKLCSKGPIAKVLGPTFAAPKISPSRLSDNKAQILHDANLAVTRFIRNSPDLEDSIRKLGLRRAAKRALSWERRHNSKYFSATLHAAYIRALAGVLKPDVQTEKILCATFREMNNIIYSEPQASELKK